MPIPAGTTPTTVPVGAITVDGAAPAAGVTGNPPSGHTVANDGRTVLELRNGGGVTRTAYIRLTPVDGQPVDPKQVQVPAGGRRHLRLGDPVFYGKTTGIDVDSTDLTLAAYNLTGR